MISVTGELKGEIPVKRFILEGLEIKQKCPKCGYEQDNDDYLSYPEMNEIFDMDLYCPECENEWSEKIKLVVDLIYYCNPDIKTTGD